MSQIIKKISASHSFFERLCNAEAKKRSRHTEDDIGNTITSIKNNLNKILNARQGHALSAPHLGLLDLNDAANTDSDVFSGIQKEVETTILTFEPRITAAVVNLISDPNNPASLKINVVAEIVVSSNQKNYSGIVIDITYNSDKRYHIE